MGMLSGLAKVTQQVAGGAERQSQARSVLGSPVLAVAQIRTQAFARDSRSWLVLFTVQSMYRGQRVSSQNNSYS